MSSQSQLITALVCTRNRGVSVTRTVESILANTHPDFELIVVDQSTDDGTAEAMVPYFADPRLRYVRSGTVGISRSRNLGIARARAAVVAITDDDCLVPPDWLERVAGIFDGRPEVAVAFYRVAAAPHDSRLGFVPAYACTGSRLLSTPRDKCRARGIGAGMAVRASAVRAVGGFDERLAGCEEGDLAVRALLGGCRVYETDCVSVVHDGFRTHAEGSALSRRDWYGIGAAYAKPLKCGRWGFWPVPAYEFFVKALWPPLHDLLRLRRPRGVTRITAFIRGFVAGWRTPVDAKTLLFRDRL